MTRGALRASALAVGCGRSSVLAVLIVALAACETSGTRPDAAVAARAPAAAEAGARVQAGVGIDVGRAEGEANAERPANAPALARAEFFRGTGAIVGAGVEPRGVAIVPGGAVTLNFANADLREVIGVVLGNTLGVSYLIDNRVQGTVTVRTSAPLQRDQVLPTLESVLALNGAALELNGGVYKVVPIEEAAARAGAPSVGPAAGQLRTGFGIQVVPLRYVGAGALLEVLQPFTGPGRVLQADRDRNLIIFAGTGPESRDLVDLIRVFDVDVMAGMSFALLPLSVADPKAVVDELGAIFAQGEGGPLAGVVRFLPIERLNAVLVISPQVAYLERAQSWVQRLDRGEAGVGRRIFVYYLENARAADVANVLGGVFGGGATPAPAPLSLAPGGVAASVVTPGAAQAAPAAGQPQQTAQPRTAATQQRTGQAATPPAARTATNARTVGTAARPAAPTAAAAAASDTGIRIIADETNNALVILASEAEYRMIEATLRRLDIMPLQVLIEATVAEVTLTDDLRYGLNWFFRSEENSITFSGLKSGAIAGVFPGFAYLLAGGDARVVLNALSEITNVNVISSPQLMVLDNQSARIQVGDQVPIATQSETRLDQNGDPLNTVSTNTIQYQDTGVILEVTPRVSAGGLVVMEVLQEVSAAVANSFSTLNSPTIQQRQIRSTVAVNDGETIALGGLIRDDRTNGRAGVPWLSQIPLLGNLFKTTSVNSSRTELLVLISPRVVRNRNDARAVTEELRRRLAAGSALEQRIGR